MPKEIQQYMLYNYFNQFIINIFKKIKTKTKLNQGVSIIHLTFKISV